MEENKELRSITELVSSQPVLLKEDIQNKEQDFFEILKMFAPGTSLRSALDDLLGARMGALIVVENNQVWKIVEKGFRINAKFSPQKLVELAKMDGAIILSRNMKKILYANALLFPSTKVNTRETGIRHKSAERTAKQTEALVIAVSERKNKITIYYGDLKHELKGSSEILRRAAETLQILEKQREVFNEFIINLNLLELEGIVTLNDLCEILQRLEIIKRVSGIVKRYLIELGKEGMVVSMRLKELTRTLNKEEEMILRDYFGIKYLEIEDALEKMGFDALLEIPEISKILFGETQEKFIFPKGLRILSKINIPERYIPALIDKYGNLDKILSLEENDLFEIFESREMLDSFNKKFSSLKEKIVMGKAI